MKAFPQGADAPRSPTSALLWRAAAFRIASPLALPLLGGLVIVSTVLAARHRKALELLAGFTVPVTSLYVILW
jgi:hypothetical protein